MYNVVTSYIKLKIRPGIYTSCSFYTHQNVNKYGGWIMKQVISNLESKYGRLRRRIRELLVFVYLKCNVPTLSHVILLKGDF